MVVFVLFRMTIIWGIIKKFFSILSPFIYGFVMAYLLMPVFNMLYRNLQPPMSRKFKNGTRLAKGLCSALTLAFGLAVVGVLLWMVLPQLSVLGFSDGEFADRKTARAEADWLCSDYLNENDRVFFVSQGDNGEHWFSAVFDFYPVLVDYSGVGATQEGGGGTFGLPELEPQEEGVKQRYYHPYTAERLDETVRANGCTVLYLQKIDDIFVQSYQNLFTDHLAAAQAGQTLLYRVTDAGYEPVTMQMSKEAAQ